MSCFRSASMKRTGDMIGWPLNKILEKLNQFPVPQKRLLLSHFLIFIFTAQVKSPHYKTP